MKAWNVYLHSRIIDTIYCDPTLTRDEVRKGLVNHDGYSYSIIIRLKRGR
jgi:hypothetical protein